MPTSSKEKANEASAGSKVAIWIPARLGSTRVKEKLLQRVRGRAILEYTLDNALAAADLLGGDAGMVRLVTDSDALANIATRAGARVSMVTAQCSSGTARLAAALKRLTGDDQPDLIINLQGDEPLMPPALIASMARWMGAQPHIKMGTVMRTGEVEGEGVSVVVDQKDHALYFSRQTLPGRHPTRGEILRTNKRLPWGRHIGLYGYRKEVLQEWLNWSPGALEEREGLEQLRALEYGIAIAVLRAEENRATRPMRSEENSDLERSWFSIDTENDLKRFEALT